MKCNTYLRIVVGCVFGICRLGLEQHLHDITGVVGELFASDSQTDQRDAFDRLSAKKTKFGRCSILNHVLQTGNESVVVGNEFLFGCVGDGGDGGDYLLQHKLVALLDQFIELGGEDCLQLGNNGVQIGSENCLRAIFAEVNQRSTY